MSEDFPARHRASDNLLGVYRHHNALRAKALCGNPNKLRVVNGRRIDRYFIGTGIQHQPDIFDFANTATHG